MSSPPVHFTGKRVVVMGLGRFGGGVGVARWLGRQGARVLVTDLADEATLRDSIDQLADWSIDFRLGGHDSADLDDADLLVVNPAVHKDRSSFFQEAVRRSLPWTTEINLFLERCPARVVGVTGTAGKSTTAAMIHTVLSGKAYLGGNVGRSLLSELGEMTSDDVVVLELSSFQLADLQGIARRPDLAVITTIWPNHLDRHGTFELYLDAKLNIIRGAKANTSLVLGDIEGSPLDVIKQFAEHARVEIIFSQERTSEIQVGVLGRHNVLNAQCAATACTLLGVETDAIGRGLEQFRGLPHRLELAGHCDGVEYFNDSKSTSPKAAATALRAFDRPVVVLVGGQDKEVSLDEMVDTILLRAEAAVCFGAAGGRVYEAIDRARAGNSTPELERVDRLGDAVECARRLARTGDVVLLSPGFPSYDEFLNYEDRGAAFTSRVRRLKV